jgi:nicotinamidase-related amidase
MYSQLSNGGDRIEDTVLIDAEEHMTSTLATAAFSTDTADVARRPLEVSQCALVVVDIQQKLLPPIFNQEELVRNSQLLVRLAKILSLPIMLTTQYSKGLGATVPEIASLLDGTPAIDKVEFGCFGSNQFRSALKALPGDRNTVLLCGMEAHICVMQTALGALNEGYLVHVASDAVGSRAEWNWKIGLDRMRDAGAVISSTEMMMYELLRCSGTPAFKELLPYLK